MNKAYKVVFNKLRGTMMVVNEATSSIQKKGAKKVIATAAVSMLAGMSGTAMAATELTSATIDSPYHGRVRTKSWTKSMT